MKSKVKRFIVLNLILLITMPLCAQIINSLIDSKFMMSFNGKYFIGLLRFSTYTNFLNISNPINGACYFFIAFCDFSQIMKNMKIVKVDDKYTDEEDYGSHGTSRWQTKDEMLENYSGNDVGWFLGSVKNENYVLDINNGLYLAVENKMGLNMQCVVVGPPGSKKTTGYILPNILSLPRAYKKLNNGEMPDLIITDPKPELYPLTSNYLREYDYDIKVLDFIDLLYGDSLNIFDFINDDKTLLQIAKGYVDSVHGTDKITSGSDQDFWNDQEAQLLAALMGFVQQVYPKEKQNMTLVAKLLTSEEVYDIDEAHELFKDKNIKGAPEQLWKNYLSIADNERTRSNILGGLAEKLKLFAIEGIRNITNTSTFNISQLGAKKERPIAVFFLMPDEDRTFSPIINVFINCMFSQMYKTARKTNARLENPVYCLFDEMANIGKIPNIKERLGGMRGRRIYPMMIWQSLAQMRDRYKEAWEDIVSMCDTQIYLGINDEFSAKICSDTLGDKTIKIQATTIKTNDGILNENQSENYSFQARKLLKPEECRRFDKDMLILWQRTLQPSKIYKTQYKYWENEICPRAKVEDLPLLKDNIYRDKNDIIEDLNEVEINNGMVEGKEFANKKQDEDITLEDVRKMFKD